MLKVYLTGLIYFNGCNQDERRVFAPDVRGHHASLWLEASQLNEGETQWWTGSRKSRDVEGVQVIEFRIPAPATITFPDEGNTVSCDDLENKLPKLKKKKQDEPDEDFDVDLENAQTIAEVTISGGDIRPLRFNKIGLVQWTIANPSGLQITAELKGNASETGTITLNTGEAEVVFLNTHDLPDEDDEVDVLHGNHVALFIKLNPKSNATVVSQKAKGSADKLKNKDAPAALNFLRKIDFTCGDTPGCCTG
jgi:hypothetical protein